MIYTEFAYLKDVVFKTDSMKWTPKKLVRRMLPVSIHARRIWSGQLRGQKIVTSWHDYPSAILGRTEGALLRWFNENVQSDETWLDIGAHYGYTALALSQLVGSQGRVFAFEPLVSTAGNLLQTKRLNGATQVTVIAMALGNPETLEMKSASITRGMVDGTMESGEECVTCEMIVVARLDWLWHIICGNEERIDGVKIDVQGMEIEVLKGMRDTLVLQHPKLVVEFHRGVDRDSLLDFLEGIGYERLAEAIDPAHDEISPQYLDDHSYAFCTAGTQNKA
jgi:FkbM family methyltransferase